jgi:hypothetical protein
MPAGNVIQGLLGSDKPPKAILNRYTAPVARAGAALAANTLRGLIPGGQLAYDIYMAGQGRQEGLAGQQENVLNTLLNRRLADDPNQNLANIFQTAFSQIDPNVVSPLARFDVNSNILAQRARGISPGAIDSTAERLRNARVASGRYYDVARNVYNVVPQLFNSAAAQGQANDFAAAGFVPQISAGYEAVSGRPTQGIMNRISTAGAGGNLAGQAIGNVNAATQGFKTPRNFADRLGSTMAAEEQGIMNLAQGALSSIGGMGGGEGGGGGGGGGAPAAGSIYPGAGGMYQSIATPTGGYSAPFR